MLSICENQEILDSFVDLEIFGDAKLAGELLGYPKCCLKNFDNISSLGSKWSLFYVDDFKRNNKAYYNCNRFPIFFNSISPVGELFPCSLSCKNAKKYSLNMIKDMEYFGYSELVSKMIEISKKTIYIDSHGAFSLVKKPNSSEIFFK
jgi:hypothetical protein|tara:strand:- start:351 stop:794 length:444 start_codon:yes stop_codon:yes gene_type:complete